MVTGDLRALIGHIIFRAGRGGRVDRRDTDAGDRQATRRDVEVESTDHQRAFVIRNNAAEPAGRPECTLHRRSLSNVFSRILTTRKPRRVSSQPEVIDELKRVDQISIHRGTGDGMQTQRLEHRTVNRSGQGRAVEQREISGRGAIGRAKRFDHFAGKCVLQFITPSEFRMGRFRNDPRLHIGVNRVEKRLRHFLQLNVDADTPRGTITGQKRDIARRNDHASAGRRHKNRRVLARGLVELDGGS